jgi:hypothetical protein
MAWVVTPPVWSKSDTTCAQTIDAQPDNKTAANAAETAKTLVLICVLCFPDAPFIYSTRKDEKGPVRQRNDRYPVLTSRWQSLANPMDVADRNPNWVATDEDHFVYRLGPPMCPQKEIKSGKLYMNGRVWCAIDTLQSGAFESISDA